MNATITGTQAGEPVCKPDLPAAIRGSLQRSRTRRYDSSGRLVSGAPARGPLHRRRPRQMIRVGIACWLLLSFANNHVLQTVTTVLFFVIVFVLVTLRLASGLTRMADTAVLRLSRGKFVDPADLCGASRVQLLRSQRAAGAVTASALYRDGILDREASCETLAAHRWEIARLLSELERLRAEHARRRGSAAPGIAGPEVADVARSQERAFAQVSAAVDGRVTALETYAAQVGAAETAYLAWQHARHLAELEGQCLDLVARADGGDYTTEQIKELSGSASAARRLFQESLAETREAAQALTSALTA